MILYSAFRHAVLAELRHLSRQLLIIRAFHGLPPLVSHLCQDGISTKTLSETIYPVLYHQRPIVGYQSHQQVES